jgi:nucleoside-diphosphate-sugar epimerase
LIVILGLGFTGERLARRLLKRGIPVAAVVRNPERFSDLAAAGLILPDPDRLPKGATIFYSIPPLPATQARELSGRIAGLEPARIVYISSTGVYGNQELVNERTPVRPAEERAWARLEDENRIAAGLRSERQWTSLILRSAAIYGPGRGVHAAVRENRIPRGAGGGVVSRIHVDDLAALAEAGLFAPLQGAWPVADEDPCPTDEIVHWCGGTVESEASGRKSGRRVDGRKIFERLGVGLRYRSWKTGVPASVSEEDRSRSISRAGYNGLAEAP